MISDGTIQTKGYKNLFCCYTLQCEREKETMRTEIKTPDDEGKIVFDYNKHHYFSQVTDSILTYLLNSNVDFQ